MQRIGPLLVGWVTLAAGPAVAQQAAGTMLWRLAATTLPVPPALATGTAATFWNPAQADDSARTALAIEALQTPAAIGASGMIAALRVRVRAVGEVGLVYGRVGVGDITRTADSPDPVGGTVAVYTSVIGATWSRALGDSGARTIIGATLGFHETRLDAARAQRWTIDIGAGRTLAGGALRVAAATHFFSSLDAADPAQDIYAGIEGRLWQGSLWGDRALLRGRYGLSFAHGFAPDHVFGAGGEFGGGTSLALDAGVVREGSSGVAGWRLVAGLRLRVGKYRVTLARDAGVNELGSTYRVGVDARFR
ncbi:MAG: hypothetical protein ACREME_09330 [Gemmatimonadales bacterium]